MSYVLKALKKSQQARDLGTVPTLADTADIAPEEETKGRRWPWVISSALLLNVVVLGIFLWQSSPNASLRETIASVRSFVVTEEVTEAAVETTRMVQPAVASDVSAPAEAGSEAQADTQQASGQPAASETAAAASQSVTPALNNMAQESLQELQEAGAQQVAMAPLADPDAATADAEAAPKLTRKEAAEKRRAAAKKKREAAQKRKLAAKKKREAAAKKRAAAKAKREAAALKRAEAKKKREAKANDLAAGESVVEGTETTTTALKQPPIPQPKPKFQRASVTRLPDITDKQQAIAEQQELAKAVPGDEAIAEAAPRTAAPNVQLDPAFQSLPIVADLPPAFRNSLPKMALSLHVYDDNAERRFVRINKKKYREGDTLKEGPVLDAIVPDGMVLSFRNKQFIVPN